MNTTPEFKRLEEEKEFLIKENSSLKYQNEVFRDRINALINPDELKNELIAATRNTYKYEASVDSIMSGGEYDPNYVEWLEERCIAEELYSSTE